MKAILVRQPGGAEQLYLGEHPTPTPARGELLVRVRATALNRADVLQREGHYPPPPGASPVLGLDVAGEVVQASAGCTGWNRGERLFALLPGGGDAEYATLPEAMAMRIPDGMTYEEAAAIPEVFLTAYQALRLLGDLRSGRRVLIHAGASGVGTAAIQLVRAFGCHPYVTASGGKLAACRALGAELAFDYANDDFVARIAEATDGRGVDLVLDFLGAPYLSRNVEALALDGRIVLLATLAGAVAEQFSLQPLFRKRASLITSTLRNRPLEYKVALVREFTREALPLFASGLLKPVIDSIFDWTEVAEAHRRIEGNLNIGKVVLRVS